MVLIRVRVGGAKNGCDYGAICWIEFCYAYFDKRGQDDWENELWERYLFLNNDVTNPALHTSHCSLK